MVKSANKGKSSTATPPALHIEGRKCGKRAAFLRGVWKYLTSDCFMYAPLMCPTWEGELRAGDHQLRRKDAVRKKNKLKIARCVRPSAPRSLSKTPGEVQPVSQSTFAYLNIQHAVTTPEAEERERALSRDKELEGDGLLWNEEFETEEEETSYGETASGNDGEVQFLGQREADEVVRKLLVHFGGSYSKQLGLQLEKSDQEVDKWFLAVALFSKSSNLNVSTETFKNVMASGICKIGDVLTMSQEELGRTLERAGHRSYAERTASRLRRLATQMKTEHGDGVCSMKSVSDPAELNKQLTSLFGLSSGSVRIFLRELRGIWPGAISELSSRAKNAARHLKLPLDASADVEAALNKLGQAHARHYRDCPGGLQCAMLQ